MIYYNKFGQLPRGGVITKPMQIILWEINDKFLVLSDSEKTVALPLP